jgi:hypothetical protein
MWTASMSGSSKDSCMYIRVWMRVCTHVTRKSNEYKYIQINGSDCTIVLEELSVYHAKPPTTQTKIPKRDESFINRLINGIPSPERVERIKRGECVIDAWIFAFQTSPPSSHVKSMTRPELKKLFEEVGDIKNGITDEMEIAVAKKLGYVTIRKYNCLKKKYVEHISENPRVVINSFVNDKHDEIITNDTINHQIRYSENNMLNFGSINQIKYEDSVIWEMDNKTDYNKPPGKVNLVDYPFLDPVADSVMKSTKEI